MSEDLGEAPTFQFGERLGFDDANAVTDFGLAGFVVDVVFFRPFDDFVETRMGDASDMLDDEGLVHLVGDDHANAGFTEVDLRVRGGIAHGDDRDCVGVWAQTLFLAVKAVMI